MIQVFVGSDSGRVAPHVYYQACQVSSKTITGVSETKICGTTVIEMPLTSSNDMTLWSVLLITSVLSLLLHHYLSMPLSLIQLVRDSLCY